MTIYQEPSPDLADEKLDQELNLRNYRRPSVDTAIGKLQEMLDQGMKAMIGMWNEEEGDFPIKSLGQLNDALVSCSALCSKLMQFKGIERDLIEKSDKMKALHAEGKLKKEQPND